MSYIFVGANFDVHKDLCQGVAEQVVFDRNS